MDNRTLNFYSLDIETQTTLGERIGLSFDEAENVSNGGQKNKLVVAIVSPSQEVVYEMNSNIEVQRGKLLTAGEAISAFVDKFHNNPSQLKPLRLSKKLVTKKQSQYPENSESDTLPESNVPCDKVDSSISCVKEINSEMFRQFVMEESREKNVVLLYRTPSCAFCTAASNAAHVFHTVSRLFR